MNASMFLAIGISIEFSSIGEKNDENLMEIPNAKVQASNENTIFRNP